MKTAGRDKTDFSQGPVWRVVLAQSFPLMVAQIVYLLYNIVDRIFIGHMPGEAGALALTGIGLCFPIITIIAAFTNLFSTGGAPLFAIARGAKDEQRAETIMNQTMVLLFASSFVIFVVSYLLRKPILYLFGASDSSYPYAEAYLKVYLFGTTASMVSTGMNSFINAQGYPRHGMMTILIGAIINLILDPVFIYVLNLGAAGAALATIISQMISFLWVMSFFISSQSKYRVKKALWKPDPGLIGEICSLGVTGFIVQGTNSAVQIACNVVLRSYGGDLYVGVMTVLNSIREVLSLPCQSLSQGSQPVLSYNFGAQKYSRIKTAVKFVTVVALIYTLIAWAAVIRFPASLMRIFTSDASLIEAGSRAMYIYFFGFFFMTFQFCGQSTFTSLRCVKRAVFFSLFRKVIIVVPLTFLIPSLGFGTDGVFMAEPISNVIGGVACFVTMILTVYRKLPEDGEICHI